MTARLHNVTLYVGPHEFAEMRAFYADHVGLAVVFEEPGHICCFEAGDDLAICVHEAEPAHPAGTREFLLWANVPAAPEVHLTDPQGNQVRLHQRRGSLT